MDDQLKELAENRYGQEAFIRVLFELALEEQWFDLEHVIQHDIAKSILADYSCHQRKGYFSNELFYEHWEEVIEIGWKIFSKRTGITRERVKTKLNERHNAI